MGYSAADHGTVVTTGRCADCPAPPDGAVEWLSSALGLAVFPLGGLAVGLVAVTLLRRRMAGPSRLYLATGAVIALSLVAAGSPFAPILAQGGVVVGLAVAIVAAVARVCEDGGGIGDRIGVWLGAALAVTAALVAGVVPVPELLGALVGPAMLVPLSYPFGLALGRYRVHGLLGLVGVVLVMGAVVVASVGQVIPFPGGPAYLLLPMFAFFNVVALLIGSPLVALGEARGTAGPESHDRNL